MLRKTTLTLIALIGLSGLLNSKAEAGFIFKNHSNNTVQVALVKTFVDRGGFIYSDGWVTLRPGASREFSGRFNTTHRFWLVVLQNGRSKTMRAQQFRGFRVDPKTAYLPTVAHNMVTSNRFAAAAMNNDNWLPYRRNVNRRLSQYAATKITPQSFTTNGFEIVMRNNGVSVRCWR